MWFERDVSARIRRLAGQFPALVLTGARQTGKTALLRHLFPEASFVSLDLPSAAHQADTAGDEFLQAQPEPLIVDEIQYAPGLFRHLKRVIDADRHRMGRFLMTGSQKFQLMQSASESLAGRCALLELDTLSLSEVRAGRGKKTPEPAEFLWRGGYPELHRAPDLDPRDFFTGYVATYLERDVRQALHIASLRDFERFVRACALRGGQLLNLAELARDVGIAGTTARDWLSVLEASGQVVLLEPWFNNAGKRMIKTPKLYLRDTGLMCFLLGLDSSAALERSPFIGAVWETFILGQMLRARQATGTAARIFFWRDAHGVEVDFVVEHEGRLRLIEAKWSAHVAGGREVLPLLKVRDQLARKAAPEHWIACRTARPHLLPGETSVRVLNGAEFTEWFAP
ncbi:MAG: ATP-binding protein [Verrucomicrobia bacterium]|nr:ATP-binding protein [Verrucomicrobiota bacterium]